MILILFHKASALRHLGFYFFLPWGICIHSCRHLLSISWNVWVYWLLIIHVWIIPAVRALLASHVSFALLLFHTFRISSEDVRDITIGTPLTSPLPLAKMFARRRSEQFNGNPGSVCPPGINPVKASLTTVGRWWASFTLMFYLRHRHLVARRYGYPLYCQLPMVSLKARMTKHLCLPVTEWVYACCPGIIINGPRFPCWKC